MPPRCRSPAAASAAKPGVGMSVPRAMASTASAPTPTARMRAFMALPRREHSSIACPSVGATQSGRSASIVASMPRPRALVARTSTLMAASAVSGCRTRNSAAACPHTRSTCSCARPKTTDNAPPTLTLLPPLALDEPARQMWYASEM